MKETAMQILTLLCDNNLETRFVGGCVRDELLGIEPHDYDIVSAGTPDQIATVLANAGIKTVPVGESYGVTKAIVNNVEVEIATLRIDGDYSDGRHPDRVAFTIFFEEDAMRRDFTINAMSKDRHGNLFDYCDGLSDLKRKTLRFIGNAGERITEDKLRLMRAVRFACKGFYMEHETGKAVRNNAHLISEVSAERVRDELMKILGLEPCLGLTLLDKSGILQHILPEVAALRSCQQDQIYHPEGDVLVHTELVAHQLRGQPALVVLAGLLHDIGKPAVSVVKDNGRISAINHESVGAEMAAEIMRRLRFSNEQIRFVKLLVQKHMRAHKFMELSRAHQISFKREMGDAFSALVELQHADAMAGTGRTHRAEILAILPELEEKAVVPALITGLDLITMGMKPGPAMKPILAHVRELQDAGEISTREEALAIAQQEVNNENSNK